MEKLRLVVCSLCAILIFSSVEGGPVRSNVRSNRQRRYTETFPAELRVTPSDNATLTSVDTCLKDGYEVPKNNVHCEKRVGCRAIQKSGQCCPDYQCECEKDGKIFGNGEKLSNNDSPCQVCYCQGGEISCNNVTCYIRNDCEPKYIAGRCCPEYDNCPPLEHVKFQSSKDTPQNISDNIENSSHTVISLNDNHQPDRPSTQSTTTTEIDHNANGNALGFKIKEITEKKEIRITGQKQQSSGHKFTTTTSRSTTTNYSPSTTEYVENSSSYSSSTTEDNVGYYSSSTEYPNIVETVEHLLPEEQSFKNVRHTDLDVKLTESGEDTDFLSDNKINDSEVISDDPNYGSSTSDDYRSSSIVTESVPIASTSVVVLGNNVLILDHTKENPVTIIRVQASGLQQGGVDESADESESLDIEHYSEQASGSSTEPSTSNSSPLLSSTTETYEASEPVFETVFYPGNSHEAIETEAHNPSNEDEFSGNSSGSGAGSGDFTDIAIPEGSSEGSGSGAGSLDATRNVTKLYPVDSLSSESQEYIRLVPTSSVRPEISSSTVETSSEIFDIYSTDTPSSPEVSSEIIHETTFYEPSSDSSTETAQSSSKAPETSTQNHFVTDELVPIQKTYIEDDDTHDLIDPGFVHIPDDFLLTGSQAHEISQTRQLSPKKHDELETPHAQQFTGKSFHSPQSISQNLRALDTDEPQKISLLKHSAAPGEPHLIPEWERNNTEAQSEEASTTVKVRLENILSHTVNPLHADHSSSEEIDKRFNKDVEPTTTKMPPSSNAAEKFSTEEENSSNQSSSSPYQYHPDHDAESIRIRVAPTTDKPSVESLSLETVEAKQNKVDKQDSEN